MDVQRPEQIEVRQIGSLGFAKIATLFEIIVMVVTRVASGVLLGGAFFLIGIPFLILAVVVGTVVSFISNLLYALAYNFAARIVGGLELELCDVE
jgi:K+-sensing histidine kinase KdpD